MKDKLSKLAVIVGSSILVVAFGGTVAVFNQFGNNSPEDVFVDESIEIPQDIDYVSANGYSFRYNQADWEVIEQDSGFDIKLENLRTGDVLTVVSDLRKEGQERYQPDNYGRLDERSLTSVSESFTKNVGEIKNFDNAQFYELDYTIKLFDTSTESNTVRYITTSNENVIKFISSYSSEDSKQDIENVLSTFYIY